MNKRIIIFGTGIGYQIFKNLINENNNTIRIIAYVNPLTKQKSINGITVIHPDEINKYNYDYIIVTSENYYEIENILLKNGIERSKILGLFYKMNTNNNLDLNKINKDLEILNNVFNIKLERFSLCRMSNIGRERLLNLDHSYTDYVRLATLELVAQEIYDKDLKGSVAELGVFQGEFAVHINVLFKNRKMFLFDTFQGFNDTDFEYEDEETHSSITKDLFSNTSVETVISKMKYPNNVVICKGYFPDSIKNINKRFVFVSIDVDLYKPTKEGLQYFYKRLVKGGYIFIHDYNNIAFLGVKKAVREFCNEKKISYIPISDNSGTVIITK